jgi:hypothetical protein
LAIIAHKIILPDHDGFSINLLARSSICLGIFLKFELDIFICDLDLGVGSRIKVGSADIAVFAGANLIFDDGL